MGAGQLHPQMPETVNAALSTGCDQLPGSAAPNGKPTNSCDQMTWEIVVNVTIFTVQGPFVSNLTDNMAFRA